MYANIKQNSFEYETKYIFPNTNAYALIKYLKSTCSADEVYPEGIISSIYYDTKDWKFISEKISLKC